MLLMYSLIGLDRGSCIPFYPVKLLAREDLARLLGFLEREMKVRAEFLTVGPS